MLRSLLLWLALAACSSPPPQRPAQIDPSNPAAPEAPARPIALTPSGATAPKVTTYVCPMGDPVEQDHPGKCPICGMTLVPRVVP